MSPQPDRPPRTRTPPRFDVKCGFTEDGPFIELNDHLAAQQITFDLIAALQIAAAITGAVAQMMTQGRDDARSRSRGLIAADGQPL